MPYLLSFLHLNSEDRVLEEGADVTLQFCIWNILEYISQIVFKMDSFDVLKVLEKFYVGRKILVFVHYGVGWFLRLDFELVREIIWRNSVWESFRSCWVEKLCPSEKFVDHSFACLYEGQKLLTKWFWAKSASRFPCQELQALDGGQDGRVRQEGSNAKRKKRVRSSRWAIEHVHRIYEASVVMIPYAFAIKSAC